MPGQKSIRLAKKDSGSSFLDAGFRRLQLGHPFPPASLCGKERGVSGRIAPGPFWLRRLLFCPGNEKAGLNDQLNWRSSENNYLCLSAIICVLLNLIRRL